MAQNRIPETFKVPFQENMLEMDGVLTRPWEWFFRELRSLLYPLGREKQFTLKNDQSSAAAIQGLKFSKRIAAQAVVEYLVQRVTTGTGATELIESGVFIVAFKPTSDSWDLHVVDQHSPSDAGVVFSIDSTGQVKYTSSDITGTASISSLFFRSRHLAGKNSQYSSFERT